MSQITDNIPDLGAYELAAQKVVATLEADETLAVVVKVFTTELPDEGKQFGKHEIPHLSCVTEAKDQVVDMEGNARIDRFRMLLTVTHQGLVYAGLVTDAQRLAGYIELLLESEGLKSGGFRGLDSEIAGSDGSLCVGAVSTRFYSARRERSTFYEVVAETAFEIELTRPLAGE